jgi:hypothetical protein
MIRNEAIDLLARRDLTKLSPEGRETLLLDWWHIDIASPEYDELPDLLRAEIKRSDYPNDPKSERYNPLLLIALHRSYKGVLNSYLRQQIAMIGRDESVHGDPELLTACPCCGYRSLSERGGYEICCVCFWEDDGTIDADCVSGPNHMTLRDARLNILRFGAVTERDRQHVLPDGRERYALDPVRSHAS